MTIISGTENMAGFNGFADQEPQYQLKNAFGTASVSAPDKDGMVTVTLPFQPAHAGDRPDSDTASMRGIVPPFRVPATQASRYTV